jgi:hypothetical protein
MEKGAFSLWLSPPPHHPWFHSSTPPFAFLVPFPVNDSVTYYYVDQDLRYHR